MKEFKILQCEKLHMIAFFPDGQIMGKENLCSCHECLNGNLNKCEFEPGRIINNGDANSLRMIKLMAQSMRRMKFLKSHFSPILKRFVCCLKFTTSSQWIVFFVKFWAVKPQQHLSLMLMITSLARYEIYYGSLFEKKLKRKRTLSTINCFQKK